jgi:hypothetical protein
MHARPLLALLAGPVACALTYRSAPATGYEPDATLYAGPVTHIPQTNGFCGGRSIKACIDDELYDIEPILLKCLPPESEKK